MNRIKVFILISLILTFSSALFGQFAADPNDEMYQDIQLWEGKGLVRQLPVLRPYPPQLIVDILSDVVRKGGARDAEKAKTYLSEFQQPTKFHLEAGHTSRTTTEDYYGDVYGKIEAGGWLRDNMYLEGRIEGLVMDNTSGFVLPTGQRTDVDIFDTWADVTVKDRNLNLRQSQNIDFSLGDKNIYFQAGIMRNSFGPFWGDSVVLSADAPHAGHYSFVWRNDFMSYSTVLLEIAATDYLWETTDDKFPDKHLVMQSFNFYPTDWLELGYFETVVWGGRFDLTYLLPFKELFYAQSMAGFEDNSFVGILADVRLGKNIKFPFVFYLDDTNLNDLLSFDLSTKFKVALQAGVQWTPEETGILKRLSTDYVLVTPYMYTHRSGLEDFSKETDESDADYLIRRLETLSQPNYNNYTHTGSNLGVGLDPNSDRLSFEVLLEPVKNLKVTLLGRLMRHGNASDAMIDADDRNDGTILDDGYNQFIEAIFHYDTHFLDQAVIQTTYQGGFQAKYSLPYGPGAILLEGGYLLEYIKNKELVPGKNETLHFFNVGVGYKF